MESVRENDMKFEKTYIAIAVAVAVLFIGALYVTRISGLGDMESAVLYLAAVIGGGCYWLGSKLGN